MPLIKLSDASRATIIKRAQCGESPKLIAADYNISETYVKKLAGKEDKVFIHINARNVKNVSLLTLSNPIPYEIGYYKNGNPIIAYGGVPVAPFLVFRNSRALVVGKDAQGRPVTAYIDGAAATAIATAETESGEPFDMRDKKILAATEVAEENDDLIED